jgi:hypothetical protein
LIAWSVYALSWRSPFPGFHALAPYAGAALIVWSGTHAETLVKRMLSLRPIVFVGLISYSLYLWHWPILAFARYYAVRELTGAERIGLLSISALLAVLSWRYIERPFRRRGAVLERRSLFRAAAAAIAGSAALGLTAVFAQGWPQRLDRETTRLMAGARDYNPRSDECSVLEAQDVLAGRACRVGVASAAAPSFIVWGDSHADALMTVFDRLAVAHGVSGLYLGRIGCPPLLGVDRAGTDFHCRAFNDAAREAITASGTRTVVLVARWAHYSSEPIYGQEPRTRVLISEGDAESADVRHNDAVLADGLRRTLESLKGYDVFVVSAVPEVGYEVPEALARIHYRGATSTFDRARTTTGVASTPSRRSSIVSSTVSAIRCCDPRRHCATPIAVVSRRDRERCTSTAITFRPTARRWSPDSSSRFSAANTAPPHRSPETCPSADDRVRRSADRPASRRRGTPAISRRAAVVVRMRAPSLRARAWPPAASGSPGRRAVACPYREVFA